MKETEQLKMLSESISELEEAQDLRGPRDTKPNMRKLEDWVEATEFAMMTPRRQAEMKEVLRNSDESTALDMWAANIARLLGAPKKHINAIGAEAASRLEIPGAGIEEGFNDELEENYGAAEMRKGKMGEAELLKKFEYVAREHFDILTTEEKESLKKYGMHLKGKGSGSIANSYVDHAKEILYYFSRV